MADQRQRIISSVFSRRNAKGELEESYVSHIKIWEEAEGTRKPRYILLSQASRGSGYIHKSKLNTNGTFSVGKTWRLTELRGVQVVGPLAFNITLSRTYKWQTENATDQDAFLRSLIGLFDRVAGDKSALQLIGLSEPDRYQNGRQKIQNDYMRASQDIPPVSTSPQTSARSRTPLHGDVDIDTQASTLAPRSQSRPASPSTSMRSYSSAGRARQRQVEPEPRTSRVRRPSATETSAVPLPIPSGRSTPSTSRVAPNEPSPANESIPSTRKQPSPTPSTHPRKQVQRTHTNGPPLPDGRRDANARISFFDPANQALIDRLISQGVDEDDGGEESSQATLANVEEMLEGYEWASEDIIGRKTARGTADMIEARLLDELMALEKANVHSFLEADDRIALVLKTMEDAIGELDNMGSLVSSYKIHLNAVGDDISYIQSQNRGLQVQTQNQRTLLAEVDNLLNTLQIDKDVLSILNQESMDRPGSIQRLEEAAAELYKALQAGRDNEMAASMERLQEYRTHNAQFCKRIYDFLETMFKVQTELLLGDTNGLTRGTSKPTVLPHDSFESNLGRYSGLMLYLREMDEDIYKRVCGEYFSTASRLHGSQMRALLSNSQSQVRRVSEDEPEQGLGGVPSSATVKSSMKRANTIIRSPLDGRNKEKEKSPGELKASEVLSMILEQIAPQIDGEDEFITDFLQINDTALTYADYMGLDNYFRRQAARSAGTSNATMKLVRSAMDLIFGFFPNELKAWLDDALAKDGTQIYGILACIEGFLIALESRSSRYLTGVLEKQHSRLRGLFDRHISEQIQTVEQTKLTSKKRKGVAPFVRNFPPYVARVEAQLAGAEGLEMRSTVDSAYGKIVDAMLESLKHMAKLDGEGEDKGQLNFHVIIIENMHHFVVEIGKLDLGSAAVLLRKAQDMYDENLNAYVKMVIRRPFGKIIEFFDGVERLLKNVPPSEVASNSNHSKSSLRKVVKEYNGKDIRKHVEALFKRIDKHFNEGSERTDESGGIVSGTVMGGIWKACEEEVLRITELFLKRITQCYADTGVSLEYGVADVTTGFKRHRH